MKKIIALSLSCAVLAACQYSTLPVADAYWQRIDTDSALYLTGPKAQQTLDQNIATCTAEVEELVRLRALRETTPPNTHAPYHHALQESGDLAAFDTPEHYSDLHVDHSEYYNFESCMRSKGWERVRAVRYQYDLDGRQNYQDTQDLRRYGATGRAAELIKREQNTSTDSEFND